ncbi:hypothetical protein BH23ACT9_BH23ACT9_24090 [soil metagenome]
MNRQSLVDAFREADTWRTFVVEAHPADGPASLITEAFSDLGSVTRTDDRYLHIVDVGQGQTFFIDHLDGRFWRAHTTMTKEDGKRLLGGVVGTRTDLDWMWLPSAHLEDTWPGARTRSIRTAFNRQRLQPGSAELRDLNLQIGGTSAEDIVALIAGHHSGAVPFATTTVEVEDPDFGRIVEGLDRRGFFTARLGDLAFHAAYVRRVVDRYRHLVEALEARAIRWDSLLDGGARIDGSAITIEFSVPIEDMNDFVSGLFSSREPFRLWGLPTEVASDVVEVQAVDLHVGQPLRFQIGDTWLRVFLFEGGCGNSVARLICNLQHHHDGALRVADPQLHELVATSTTQEILS